MSVFISDETLRACQMEAAKFKQEIALLLFQAGRLTIGHASQLTEMPPNAFRELLKQRHIPLYVYDIALTLEINTLSNKKSIQKEVKSNE